MESQTFVAFEKQGFFCLLVDDVSFKTKEKSTLPASGNGSGIFNIHAGNGFQHVEPKLAFVLFSSHLLFSILGHPVSVTLRPLGILVSARKDETAVKA